MGLIIVGAVVADDQRLREAHGLLFSVG